MIQQIEPVAILPNNIWRLDMNDQRVNVLINIANTMAISFSAVVGGLYLEWKANTLIQPTGITLLLLGVILGILTVASYLWLMRLTENKNGYCKDS